MVSVSELAECVGRLRYVSEGDEVRSEDYNTKVDCIKILLDYLGGIMDVEKLREYVNKMRYVKAMDIIEPDDHNLIVDVLKAIVEIIEEQIPAKKGYIFGCEVIPNFIDKEVEVKGKIVSVDAMSRSWNLGVAYEDTVTAKYVFISVDAMSRSWNLGVAYEDTVRSVTDSVTTY